MSVHDSMTPTDRVYHADFKATLDEVSRVCLELNTLALARCGVEWSTIIDLGLTEALSNIVRHGYGPERQGRITLACREVSGHWHFSITDHGSPIPQDLLRQADGSVFDFDPEDLHAIPEGGMGLSLLRGCFDSLGYSVNSDGNRLSLTKKLDLTA